MGPLPLASPSMIKIYLNLLKSQTELWFISHINLLCNISLKSLESPMLQCFFLWIFHIRATLSAEPVACNVLTFLLFWIHSISFQNQRNCIDYVLSTEPAKMFIPSDPVQYKVKPFFCLRKKWPEELRRYAPSKLTLLIFDIWHLTLLIFDIWHSTDGPMDQWTKRPMDQWTKRPME